MRPNQRAAVSAAQNEAMPASSLPQLCTVAAGHVASARVALHDESYDAEQAVADLNEALICLRQLLARGTASNLCVER